MQFLGEEIFYLSTKKNLLSAFYYFYFYGKFLFCLFECKEKSIVAKQRDVKHRQYMQKRKIAFIIVLVYNLLGTIAICSIYPSDAFYFYHSEFLFLFTLPVTIISFGYRFMQSEPLWPVFIIQTIMFIISALCIDWLVRRRFRK